MILICRSILKKELNPLKDYFSMEVVIESILKAREAGKFVSLMDLTSRVDLRLVNRKTLESLIKAGALDYLGSRAAQLLILDQCLEQSHKETKNRLAIK